MSDKITVSTEHLDELASLLKSLGNKLGRASGKLSGVYMNFTTANHMLRQGSCRLSGNAGVSSVSLGSTRSTVRRYSNALDAYDELCTSMSKAVKEVKERFIAVEAELSALADGDAGTIGDILGFPSDTSKWTPEMWNQYMNFKNDYNVIDMPGGRKIYANDGHFVFVDQNGNVTGEFDFGMFFDGCKPNSGDGVEGWSWNGNFIPILPGPMLPLTVAHNTVAAYEQLRDWGFEGTGSITLKDHDFAKPKKKPLYQKNGSPQSFDKTYFEVGLEKKGNGDIWGSVDGDFEKGNAYGEGKIAVGYYDYKAGIYGGLYGYDENGERIISPGVRAEIGGSFSVLHADGKLGYDFGPVQAELEGSVDVLKASAQGEVQIGFIDGEPQLYAGGELEAIAFEAKGSASFGNEYVKVKAEGSVQVGIGISGEVGYKDGVLSIEAGLAFGLGAKGKIELDIGGTVEAIADFTDDTIDAVQDVGEAIWEGAKDIGEGIGNFFGGLFS